jgi:hypothetical protein
VTTIPQTYVEPQTGAARSRNTGKANWLTARFRMMLQEMGLRGKFITAWTKRGLGLIQPRAIDPALMEHGITFVCPGIETESIFTWGICDGLTMGGVPGAMRVFNWGMALPGGYLGNLCRIDRNRRRGADLAKMIAEYQDQYPGRPVYIASQSGGAGIAVFAAEALEKGRQIEGLILLNGALSPQYDLRKALANCRKGILNSYSRKDSFVLGFGTRFFGTMDRKFCDAAGRVGFEVPTDLSSEDAALYAKLTQVEWCEEFARTTNHWGGHLSSAREEFLARYIAPWVTGTAHSSI